MRALFFVFLLNCAWLSAQDTLQLQEGQYPPKGNLEQVSWITGHWQGEVFGGISEEIWSAPDGDSMMFVFRLVNEGKVTFYEIGHMREIDNTLLMQLKHFDGNLKGWESKDETVDFKLVKIEANKVYFEGITYELISENEMHVYVLVEGKEVLFKYRKS
ncbi:DUF6265 family protein [Flagellimonas eckloniae]|uniref:DUF6265 domain-containing protein n=1 Tax=Flagellimonas eckloniae TaxID=346185 RepID=A0A0Q0XMV0_9FLAO|nr:DUF6265 family protein [Allomuricauda eckloniae]KQC30336.1 hypothetical protein AAY42_10945 [Allomuricauda eckloniae]